MYVRDTGLLHFLAGLRAPPELAVWPGRGRSFEGLVIEELAAWARERFVRPELFFWRTQAGAEVDALVVAGRRIIPFEIKHAATVTHHDVAGLRSCMRDLGLKEGFVVCRAAERRAMGGGVTIVPFSDVVRRQLP